MNNNIETERLVIRRFREGDWKDLFEYLGDEEVVFYEPYEKFTKEQCQEEARLRKDEECFWAVCLRDSGKLIGNLYIDKQDFKTCEIGYVFNRGFQKMGYATESVLALIDYAFDKMDTRRIQAKCNPENEPSWRLLERINMRREGHLRKNIFFRVDEKGNPIWQDTFIYALLKEDAIN